MTHVLAQRWEIREAGTPLEALRADEIVTDVEGLVRGVIGRVATSRELADADRDELFGHLCEQVVVLTRSYDRHRAVRSGRLVFRAWLFRELGFDAIDFLRSWLGRNGEKRVADPRVAAAGYASGIEEGGSARDGSSFVDRLALSPAASEGDSAESGADALGWLYARGDRATLREERRLGLHPGTGAADGDDRPAARAGGRDAGGAARTGAQAGGGCDCPACGWRNYRVVEPNGDRRWRFPDRCVACGADLAVAA